MEKKPIVSGGATSPIFAQENYGYVSRSIPSDVNVIKAFVQLIVDYEIDLINVVYVNDEYGQTVVEALVQLSQGLFQIQLLRTFESANDEEGINNVLDDLQSSPTQVTFLGSTTLETGNFLNAAGQRGMHETHLWLSPQALQVMDQLDPPSTGGIWTIAYGEELTETNPFGQRYMAKDPSIHIEAQKYGFQDDYNELTYWGSYAYDAVLAAAHGLAAAQNRSDGEEVLRAIRSLSLNNTVTGALQLDENGDRIGARIPVFYVTPNGTSEQFAAYYSETLEFLQDPLWPGGGTTKPSDLIRDDFICKSGTYWSESNQACLDCPSFANITTSEEIMIFEGVSNTPIYDTSTISVTNENDSPVDLFLKSTPPFINHIGVDIDSQDQKLGVIGAGSTLFLEFGSSSETLSAGVAVGDVVLGVSGAGTYTRCFGKDIRIETTVNVSPTAELNQLGGISAVGWTLFVIVTLTTFITAVWSFKNRTHPAIKKMQPPFLFAILFGVLVLSSAIIPMSIDDGIATERGCDVKCMATPWLLSMGACIVFSALFSKLWRLNQLLGSGLRRVTLKEKDVILPAVIMFVLDMIILVCWTAISPLQWERVPVDGQPWNTVGICASENTALQKGCLITLAIINIGALLLACWQAYNARGHSGEFSEARGIGIAMYSWLQLGLVGIPVMLLIDQDDVTSSYFVQIGLVFLVCMSLLVSIFLPIWKNKKEHDNRPAHRTNTTVSGVNMTSVSSNNRNSVISGVNMSAAPNNNINRLATM